MLSLYFDVSAELIGIGITVLVIDCLYRRREEQQLEQQLVREMGSADNGIALRAVEELRAHGWLEDGSLRGARLRGANLAHVDLQKAHMQGSSLFRANLAGAILAEIHVEGASLVSANLRDANLYLAHLEGADLFRADLKGATLWKACLEGAINLESACMRGAQCTDDTRWPDGFDYKDAGVVNLGELQIGTD